MSRHAVGQRWSTLKWYLLLRYRTIYDVEISVNGAPVGILYSVPRRQAVQMVLRLARMEQEDKTIVRGRVKSYSILPWIKTKR